MALPLLLLFHIQEVIVDFEAHTISANDFNGVKKLLQQVRDSICVTSKLSRSYVTLI